jgi:5-methyltetrahydropteroyltriglutamate--homocysteine methyltransferase
MVKSAVLGFPRMGVLRDLKKATEAYWGGKLSREELLSEGKRLRLAHWKIQQDAGVDVIPSNDFAFYDQFLDHIALFGVSIPDLDTRSFMTMTDCYFHLGCPREILQAQARPYR